MFNFITLHVGRREVLINLSNVTEVHSETTKSGCVVYFNTMAGNYDQALLISDESLEEVRALINANNNN